MPHALRRLVAQLPGPANLIGRNLDLLAWNDAAAALFPFEHYLLPGETAFTALVERVRLESPEFEAWWSEHGVRAPVSGTKRLHHPTLRAVDYDHASFQADDDPVLRLVIYTCRV